MPYAIEFSEQLRALPTKHCDVNYSHLVRVAARDRSWTPDVVAVELPESFRDAVVGGVRRDGGALWASRGLVPEDDGSSALRPVVEVVSLHSGDAIIEAVRWALEIDAELLFIDKEIDRQEHLKSFQQRPEVEPFDSSRVALEGIEAHCRRLADLAESTRISGVDGPREDFMAAHLRGQLDAGKRVFFVCGMAHWSFIEEALRSGRPLPEPVSAPMAAARLVCGGNLTISMRGGEMPRVVAEFERMRRAGRDHRFSHVAAVEKVVERSKRRFLSEGLSTGELLVFERFLRRICARDGFASPSLLHLLEASATCLPETVRPVVFEEATKRRLGCPDDLPRMPDLGIVAENISDRLASRWDRITASIPGTSKHLVRVTTRKAKVKSQTIPDWDRHVCHMNALAVARTRPLEHAPSRRTGVVRGPVDVRGTVRARACGESDVRTLERQRIDPKGVDLFEVFMPIVWDFGIGEDRFHQHLNDDWLDGPVIGLSSYKAREARSYELSGMVVLAPSLAYPDRKRARRWVECRGVDCTPRQGEPYRWRRESVAAGGSTADAFVETALRCARSSVLYIGVAAPSARMLATAQRMSRRLIHLPIALFDRRGVERLRHMPTEPIGGS